MKHRSGSQVRNRSGYIVPFIISLAVGFVFWLVGEALFSPLTESLFTPLGILLYFLIFFCFIAVYGIIAGLVRNGGKHVGLVLKNAAKLLIILLIVFLFASGVFEFLYELGKSSLPAPTSYIFLIDDSGSMSGTEQERTDAVNDVMKDSTLPFAVYKFSQQAVLVKQMGRYSGIGSELVFESSGVTDIMGSLRSVVDDVASGKLSGAGASPRILLLSDGGSRNNGLNSIVKRCKSLHVMISTIGVGGCNASLLKKIAKMTGGGFVYCSDVAGLTQGMSQALVAESGRNLLSERYVFGRDALYAILRILFLTLLGIPWSVLKSIVADLEDAVFKRFIIISSVCCCLGAVIVEFGAAEQTIAFLRLIFVLLWAILPGGQRIVKEPQPVAVAPSPPPNFPFKDPNTDPSLTGNVSRLGGEAAMPPGAGNPMRLDGGANIGTGNSGPSGNQKPSGGPPMPPMPF